MQNIYNILIALFMVSVSIEASAQASKVFKYSFGSGLLVGYSHLVDGAEKGPSIGLKLDYQNNISKWFSLRLETSYVYHDNHTFQNTVNSPFRGTESVTIDAIMSGGQFGVSLAPIFYFRQNGFNIFGGLAGGIGIINLNTIGELTTVENGFSSTKNINQRQMHYALGLNPLAGISYNFNKSGSRSTEFEMTVVIPRWFNKWEPSLLYTQAIRMSGVSLQFTYRILLKK